MANSSDPDQILYSVASDLGLDFCSGLSVQILGVNTVILPNIAAYLSKHLFKFKRSHNISTDKLITMAIVYYFFFIFAPKCLLWILI